MEDIPRESFDDWNPRTKRLAEYWAELFNRVEEMKITKGGEPHSHKTITVKIELKGGG